MNGGATAEVLVFPDPESMSRAAAELFLTSAQNAVHSRGRFIVVLSGGSTPLRLYALLGSIPYRDKIHWPGVHVFWADERCVPRGHPDSNFKRAYETLLSTVPLPEGNVHRIRGEAGPEKAAREYEDDLRGFFRSAGAPVFDLIILGVGEDGHTASLFPGSPALKETARLVVPVYGEKPRTNRVTLTLPALNNARQALFLAAGDSKADVLFDILEQGNEGRCPAGLVKPVHGALQWLTDRKAARRLTRRT